MKNSKIITGSILIVIGIISPVMFYLIYVGLIRMNGAVPSGAEGACLCSGFISVLAFIGGGIALITSTLEEKI